MGRRARAVELVLGNVIERAVSDSGPPDQHKSTIVHDATLKTPSDDTSSSRPSSSIFDNCQAVNSLHPQFDTSKALKHGIAHSMMPSSALADDDGESIDSDGGRSSFNESAISIGRMPSTTTFKPIGNITLQKFREAIAQKHEVRYRSGAELRDPHQHQQQQAESPATSRGTLKSIKFSFKTYAGEVFAAIRSSLDITTDDYVRSLANNEAFQDFVSNSKSGAFFFFTTDGKYIIKTMSHNESLWFRDFLPDYFQHLHHHPLSVLVRIVGLYRLKFSGGTRHNLHFYVMLNVFSRNESIPIHYKFDLKGSTYGREAKDSEPVLKDVDFERLQFKLELGSHRDHFLSTLNTDADFLAKAKQMDYSLLVGIYDRRKDSPDLTEEELLARLGYTAEEALQPLSYDRRGILSFDDENKIRFVYFLGIIDYLQKYNWRKKAEHFFKAIRHDGDSISAVNPTIYGHRFTSFIEKHLS